MKYFNTTFFVIFLSLLTVFSFSLPTFATSDTTNSVQPFSEPNRVKPIFKHGLKGEGKWSLKKTPTCAANQPPIYRTWLRVDGERPYVRVDLMAFKRDAVDLHLVAGTDEPKSTIGIRGTGIIPKDEALRSQLICAFNGGFRTEHGKFGFITDGITYVPPKNNIATIAVDETGEIHLGVWGKTLGPEGNFTHLRQNLKPLATDGKIRTKNQYWGKSIDGDTNVWRSGIGVTADGQYLIFAAGPDLSSRTLAKALVRAGCNFAMQLDINDYHTYLIYYEQKPTTLGTLRQVPHKLNSKMGIEIKRCLTPYNRDFFYMTWKPKYQTLAPKAVPSPITPKE